MFYLSSAIRSNRTSPLLSKIIFSLVMKYYQFSLLSIIFIKRGIYLIYNRQSFIFTKHCNYSLKNLLHTFSMTFIARQLKLYLRGVMKMKIMKDLRRGRKETNERMNERADLREIKMIYLLVINF